jgi:uncharacterized protein (DUF433 family)
MAQPQQPTIYEQYFVRETPGVCGGSPCVGNTRIPVRLIVAFTRDGVTIPELLELYPHLTAEQLHGALAFYAAYPARIDKEIEENARAIAEIQARR